MRRYGIIEDSDYDFDCGARSMRVFLITEAELDAMMGRSSRGTRERIARTIRAETSFDESEQHDC